MSLIETGLNWRILSVTFIWSAKMRIMDLHIHNLCATYSQGKMTMNGTSLYITGKLLGHRTTQMTKRYSHLVPETLKKP
ncbi:MAG: hypothetical protein M1576_00270 [Deltaproteobacteria bacterium]|nr:hypothetical protein [Deltaproteobacteria bacterium]